MSIQNQKLQLQLSLIGMLIAVITRIINHYSILPHEHGVNLNTAFYIMIVITGFVFMLNAAVYIKRIHPWFPWMNALHLTLTSITIIVAGNGMVEYHFSIFMVMTVIAFYQQISLIVFSTIIFAVQHFGSYLFMPEFAYGQPDYPFWMVAIHAFFLVLTSAAAIAQIYRKRKDWHLLEAENSRQKQTIDQLIDNLSQTSDSIDRHARNLLHHAESNNKQSKDVYHQTLSISEQTNQNLRMVSQVSHLVERMNLEIWQIADNNALLAADLDASKNKALQGNELVKRTRQQMELVNASSVTASSIMDDLVLRASEAQQIVDLVKEIAIQTNLLALNAAIEAAHVQEHGSGFMVVAKEIRKLSEQTNNSASTILQVLEDMQRMTKETKATINRLSQHIELGNDLMNETNQVLLDIVQSNHNIHLKMQDITSLSTSIAESSSTINESMSSSAEVSENIMANVRSVRDISQKQNSSMGHLLISVNHLNEIAGKLQEIVSQITQGGMPNRSHNEREH